MPIPALIVQPLVENAIKHGIAQSRKGGEVRVVARVHMADDTSQLTTTVTNTGAHVVGPHPVAAAASRTQRSLRCHYGDNAALTLDRDRASGLIVATVVLPATELNLDETPALVERNRR